MRSIRNQLRLKGKVSVTFASFKTNATAGFTIIELLVATLVFSMVLLLIAVGVLQFNHAYYSGVTQTNTQDTARAILEDVSQAIQFSGGMITSPIRSTGTGYYTVSGFCIGNERYSYVLGWQLEGAVNTTLHQTNYGLLKDNNGDCSGKSAQDFSRPRSLAGNSIEMLRPHMRLTKLSVTPLSGSAGLYQVDVRVVYGDDALLSSPVTSANTVCMNGSGSQFCSVSELSTVVQMRVQ